MIVKTINGDKLKISPLLDIGIERKLYHQGVYEEGTLYCFKKILKKGDVVLDVGANIGLTTIRASKLIGSKGKVYAIEAMPSTFQILIFNLHLNNLTNVTAYNEALAEYVGISELFYNLDINRGSASLYSDEKKEGVEIKINTLDQFVIEHDIKTIDFIKIDIEGAEYPMLMGGSNFLEKNKPIICIEFSREVKSKYASELIFDVLKYTYSYRIFRQIGGKKSISKLIEIKNSRELPNHDNLYCFQKKHFQTLDADLFHVKS
ncbi:MAG: FkbM family methyltransferase [Aquaticitalea sp.]